MGSAFGIPFVYQSLGISFEMITAELPNEHPDLYEFHRRVESFFGIKIIRIKSPESPMQIFNRVGILGNSRIDVCSEQGKRKFLRQYIKEHYAKGTILSFGILGTEQRRMASIERNWGEAGYIAEFPLQNVMWNTSEWMQFVDKELGFVPEPYKQGFEHNNCDRLCVKAGAEHWRKALYFNRKGFLEMERGEIEFNAKLRLKKGEDTPFYTFLRRQINGVKQSFPLYQLREETEADWAKNGCPYDPNHSSTMKYDGEYVFTVKAGLKGYTGYAISPDGLRELANARTQFAISAEWSSLGYIEVDEATYDTIVKRRIDIRANKPNN
jgi:hypothetical protein